MRGLAVAVLIVGCGGGPAPRIDAPPSAFSDRVILRADRAPIVAAVAFDGHDLPLGVGYAIAAPDLAAARAIAHTIAVTTTDGAHVTLPFVVGDCNHQCSGCDVVTETETWQVEGTSASTLVLGSDSGRCELRDGTGLGWTY